MSHPRYHYSTVLLHWLTFIAIVAVLGAVLLREVTEDNELRLQLLNLHRSVGVLVLILFVIRLVVRYFYFFTHVTATLPKILRRLAGIGHFIIYALLFLVPLLGWLFTSAAGKPLVFFGTLHLPALIHKNRELADVIGEAHEVLAWIFMLVIVGHIAAALWHHFFRKDHVLRAILPVRSGKK